MNRREFIRRGASGAVAAATAFAFGVPNVLADQFLTLRRGVGTYTNRGGTMGWLVRDDAIVVVDAQYPETATIFLDGLRQRSSRRIDYLINTHHHGDHTNGNPAFRDHVDTIVAHENVPTWQWNRARERELPDPVVADETFADELVLDVGDESVRLTHHGRAHTSGDAVIHFEEANIVHMGDLIFHRWPAFIDRDAGARIDGWMEVLQTTHDRFDDETLFIFGHGKSIIGGRGDLLYMRDFLGGLLAFADVGIKAGKTKEEIMSTTQLPDFPDNYNPNWENGISNALGKAYEELTEAR